MGLVQRVQRVQEVQRAGAAGVTVHWEAWQFADR
jgi:hypothetical protein